MVHFRVNERESNPNPHVNFITALPAQSERAQEEARQLLRALAAQVRPVMKAHGFAVNTLEEVRELRWDHGLPVSLPAELLHADSMNITRCLWDATGITERL